MSHPTLEREIFEACLELPRSEWAAHVGSAAPGDPQLQKRILRLLAAHEMAGESTEQAGSLLLEQLETPRQIGPYKILQVLGSGGMGVVYEAEQTHPVTRRVALKIIKLGMDTRQVVSRFEAERQALAVMDHPNIARVLDAGATAEGRPYFVMELVAGVPLLEFCDTKQLSTSARLEVFIPLCKAIQHAHQKGVIHRDLKPSNVLVTVQDGKPVPKVIDFGIAKAIRQPLGTNALVTRYDQVIGTAAYMSPEQAEAHGLDIDTRSDIYSLGVMLYQLLAGSLPVDPEEIGVQTFLARLSRLETDPPAPSSRLVPGESGNAIATLRSTDSTSLKRELKGDLDWIVLKAMEKERARRYQTAEALALDLQRYLNSEPVLARPQNPGYRFGKFVRRNKVGVIAAGIVLLAVIAGVAGITASLLRATRAEADARREAHRAQQAEEAAKQRLRNSLLAQARASRSSQAPGRRHHSQELLSQAAAIQPGSDLRNEAIACLALTDLRVSGEWALESETWRMVAFDGNLQRYAVGYQDGRVELRASRTAELLRILPGPGATAWKGWFSRDGRFLAIKYHGASPSQNPRLRVWNLQSAEPLFDLAVEVNEGSLDFHPDGGRVAFGTADRRILFLDLATAKQVQTVQLGEVPLGLRYHPDGSALATGVGQRIEIREPQRGALLQTLSHTADVFSLDWSADGQRIAAGYSDSLAVIWDLREPTKRTLLEGHQAEVVEIHMLSGSHLVVTYSWDETSRVWNATTGEQLLVSSSRILSSSHDGRGLSFVTGTRLGTWDILHGESFRTIPGHTGKSPSRLDISSDGRWLASGGRDGVLLWDFATGQPIGPLSSGEIRDVFFEPRSESLFTCGPDGFTRWAFSVRDRRLHNVRSAKLSTQPCLGAALDSTGQALVYGGSEKVVLLSLDGLARRTELDAFLGMSELTVSPRGEWIAGGHWRGKEVFVWNPRVRAVVAKLVPGRETARASFSPDGRWLVTGTADAYRLWAVNSWREAARFDRPPRFSQLAGSMAFSSDGKLLALALDQKLIEIRRVEDSAVVAVLETAEPQAFENLRFSADDSHLAAASNGNRILIWDLARIGNELRRLNLDQADSYWPKAKDTKSEGN